VTDRIFQQRANTLGYVRSTIQWQHFLKVSGYTFFLALVQALWIARLPYTGLRTDLLLPLMFGVAIEWPPVLSIFWAFLWGFAMDTLSGKFWGFHVGSYVVAACVVNISSEKFEFQNPLYQMSFIGLCALGQSMVLGFFLLFEPSGSLVVASTWKNLLIRSVMMMVLCPLIVYPIWSTKRNTI
jgi:rod shape-determining protein MreD